MRRLMLLRHAKTENDAPSGEDFDRALDRRGHADSVEIGRWLVGSPYRPDVVLVSPALRARQTWDGIAPLLAETGADTEVAYLPDLYLADPADLLRIVRDAATHDPRSLMLIGHNPGLHEIALMLAGTTGDFATRHALAGNLPTSGLVVIDFDVDDWRQVTFRRGRLVLFVSPRLIKEASGGE
jgi:phosphohistidine phosphatase